MVSLYFDCSNGATRGMLTSALLSLFPDHRQVQEELETLCPMRTGFPERHHHSLPEIQEQIMACGMPKAPERGALGVYELLAEAEGHVHGHARSDVVFHEVGNREAVCSVVAFSYMFWLCGADRLYASPVNVGSGTVRCSHGLLPVPAPATAYLLRDFPHYQSSIEAELCTPVSAAILRYYAAPCGDLPERSFEPYGPGNNAIRCFMTS